MAEHPTHPMRNSLLRAQVAGKIGSSVSYLRLAFNLFWDSSSDTSFFTEEGGFEIQIFEVNNSTDYNAVRSVLDYTGTLDSSSITNPTMLEETSQILNWNEDVATHYVWRGSFDDASGNAISSMAGSYFDNQQHADTASQADDLLDFGTGDVTIVTGTTITLGSGYPDLRYPANQIAPTAISLSNNTDPVWIALNVM